MPDTHVPLDEAEFIKWAYYNKEASLTGTQAREVWKYISNLKHTICVEIEEIIGNNDIYIVPPGIKEVYGYKDAYRVKAMAINKDELVKSLKESNNKCNCGNERLVERDTCEDCL